MWAETELASVAQSPRTHAEIACQLCRRRKVKCDRSLPHCKVCIQTDQVCEYPLRSKKPGPKIGSLQKIKRRYRDRENGANTINVNKCHSSDKRRSQSPPNAPSDAEMTHHGRSDVVDKGSRSFDRSGSRQPRGSRQTRRVRNEAEFENVSDSLSEDNEDADDDNNNHRRRRPVTARRTRQPAPIITETGAGRTTSPTGTGDEWTQRRRNSRLNINDLSFILHPSHEASTPEKDAALNGAVNGNEAGAGPSPAATPNNCPRNSHTTPASAVAASTPEDRQQSRIQQACAALGISEALLQSSIAGYFANMVAINLFHQPSFADKLAAVASPVQLLALLAAMMGYAVRFQKNLEQVAPSQWTALSETSTVTDHLLPPTTVSSPVDPVQMAMPSPASISMPPPPPPQPSQPHSPEHFLSMARRLIERALDECGDDPPTLIVLQACIICTHCELTRGVHGRAWRSLGMCVRLAYEMNLHLVDARMSPLPSSDTAWRDAEEKRRAWWAIWEMDVFASTIRRTPAAVDWRQMETLLPVDDADWFGKDSSAKNRRSCFMELDPVRRWKAVQASGNHSPKAWFLVINSLMKDAFIISSPSSAPFQRSKAPVPQTVPAASSPRKRRASPPDPSPIEAARQKLEILANCVQCFVLALPAHLQYRNQFLGFGAEGSGAATTDPTSSLTPSLRQLHCGIYNIFVMTQLARLMIHRFELFGSHTQHVRPTPSSSTSASTHKTLGKASPLDNPAVLPYFEAADNILNIVNRSCEEHIKHINPFLLSTIWLAAAVQLVRRHIAFPRGGSSSSGPAAARLQNQQTLIKSRFDVLYLTYKRCATFWDARTAMEQNLEALEARLEGSHRDRDRDEEEENDDERNGDHDDAQDGVQDSDQDGDHGDVHNSASDKGNAQTSNKRDRSSQGINRGHQKTRKKTRVAKDKPGHVEPASETSTNLHTSWTRSSNHPQLSPAVPRSLLPQSQTAAQPQQTQQQQQTAITVATHPNFELSPPPPPMSTYSDPTGASSFDFFKFDSPAQQHAQPDHAHNSAQASTYEASLPMHGTVQAQDLFSYMQMSAHNRQQNSSHAATAHNRADSFVVDAGDGMPGVPMSMISPALFEPDLDMNNMQQQTNGSFEWCGLDLPTDIHDLLSGFSTYYMSG